jgi:putative membrane protein
MEVVRSVVGGFLMGAADLVPGVSGGTIALVIGIYERLIASVREGSLALGSLIKADSGKFKRHFRGVEWSFLLPLLGGIMTAVISLARLLEHQLETNAEIMAGVFFGLVVGSVLIAWRLIRRPEPKHFAIALAIGMTLFVLLGFGEGSIVSDPTLLAFLGAGALAICAMILPGISGSLILLLIGMYAPVLAAVNDRDYLSLGIFILGAALGLALFSQILHWSLQHHHDVVLAALVGLMAGSLRVVWPWPDGVDSPVLGKPDVAVFGVVVAGIVGFGFVYLVARLATSREKVSEQQQTV